MGRIWGCCTDEEIAGARQRFMAGMSPQVQALSIEYTLPALDGPTRLAQPSSSSAYTTDLVKARTRRFRGNAGG